MTTTAEQVIAEALLGAGLTDKPDEFDSDIHSWRCAHPDRYGRCKCFEETVADLAAALRAANLLREPAVPDAATEVLDAHKCHESAERAYVRTIRAEAERDAALAAIERVRVLHEFDEGYCKSCEIPFHECAIATALEAALDGAPEPEGKP